MKHENFDYDLWGVKLNVGDIVKPTDGTPYRGRVVFVSQEEDTVRHQCLRTNKVWEKSYTGFGVRYHKDN